MKFVIVSKHKQRKKIINFYILSQNKIRRFFYEKIIVFTTFRAPEVRLPHLVSHGILRRRFSRAGLILCKCPILNYHQIICKSPLRIGLSLTLLFTVIHRRLCRYVEIDRRYTEQFVLTGVVLRYGFTPVCTRQLLLHGIERNLRVYMIFFSLFKKKKKRPSVMCSFNGDVTTRSVDYRARRVGVQEERYFLLLLSEQWVFLKIFDTSRLFFSFYRQLLQLSLRKRDPISVVCLPETNSVRLFSFLGTWFSRPTLCPKGKKALVTR